MHFRKLYSFKPNIVNQTVCKKKVICQGNGVQNEIIVPQDNLLDITDKPRDAEQ